MNVRNGSTPIRALCPAICPMAIGPPRELRATLPLTSPLSIRTTTVDALTVSVTPAPMRPKDAVRLAAEAGVDLDTDLPHHLRPGRVADRGRLRHHTSLRCAPAGAPQAQLELAGRAIAR